MAEFDKDVWMGPYSPLYYFVRKTYDLLYKVEAKVEVRGTGRGKASGKGILAKARGKGRGQKVHFEDDC